MARNEAEYKKKYRQTPTGKARVFLSAARRKCKKLGVEFTLDLQWVLTKIECGRCEQTGIAFSYEAPKSQRSPWTFSIDRIDPSKGYTKGNCQAVIWAYNAAKGCGTDSDVMKMARCLVGVPRDTDL